MKRTFLAILPPLLIVTGVTPAASSQVCADADMLARSVMNIRQTNLPIDYVKGTLVETSLRPLTKKLLDAAYAQPVVSPDERALVAAEFSYSVRLHYVCN